MYTSCEIIIKSKMLFNILYEQEWILITSLYFIWNRSSPKSFNTISFTSKFVLNIHICSLYANKCWIHTNVFMLSHKQIVMSNYANKFVPLKISISPKPFIQPLPVVHVPVIIKMCYISQFANWKFQTESIT